MFRVQLELLETRHFWKKLAEAGVYKHPGCCSNFEVHGLGLVVFGGFGFRVWCFISLVAEWIHFTLFWDNITHFKTKSVHFWGLICTQQLS